MLFPKKERKIIIAGEKGILLWDDTVLEGDKLRLYNKGAFYDNKSGKIEYSSDNSFKSLKVKFLSSNG